MSQPLKYLTILWIAIIAGVASFSVYNQPISVEELASRFDFITCLVIFALIVFGKSVLIVQVHLTLKTAGESRGFLFSWMAYSLADVGKYLPGGVWGIAGRLGIYKQAKIPIRRGARLVLFETLLVIVYSSAIGLAILLWTGILGFADTKQIALALVCLAAPFILTFAFFMSLGLGTVILMFLILSLTWIAFGISFALVASKGLLWEIEMAGVFNIGFAAGQLAIFAPSGIGVREWVISILSRSDGVGTTRFIIELVLGHRVIWMIADFGMLLPLGLMRFPTDFKNKVEGTYFHQSTSNKQDHNRPIDTSE